ncbi:MAG: hypothetical protein RR666_04480, partial [Raoultibacter sp.]
MAQLTHSNCFAKAFFTFAVAISLVTGLVPALAFADTSVKVSTAAPTQTSETTPITETQSATSTQATASVALAADTTTVLENGLVFVIDNATNKAAITGWYGTQPAQNLSVPAEIRHNGKLVEVNILGGGGLLAVLGSEDSTKQT